MKRQPARSFQDLIAWQKAHQWVLSVYRYSDGFPRRGGILNFNSEFWLLNKLVYFEETQDITAAIAREKEIKKWRREKKN